MAEYPRSRLNYVELSVGDTSSSRKFYEAVFGWAFTEFAPDYAATVTDDTDIGLAGQAQALPLPVIESDDLEASYALVERAGGSIERPIFAFPGGRRFHFKDTDGNEIAIWQRD